MKQLFIEDYYSKKDKERDNAKIAMFNNCNRERFLDGNKMIKRFVKPLNIAHHQRTSRKKRKVVDHVRDSYDKMKEALAKGKYDHIKLPESTLEVAKRRATTQFKFNFDGFIELGMKTITLEQLQNVEEKVNPMNQTHQASFPTIPYLVDPSNVENPALKSLYGKLNPIDQDAHVENQMRSLEQ